MSKEPRKPMQKPDATTTLGLKIFGYGSVLALIAAFAIGHFVLN